MSTYKYYYDTMIMSPELTFRILGRKSSNQTEADNTVSVIVRDFIRDPLTFSVTHNYTQNSGGITNAIQNFKTFLDNAELKWEEIKAKFEGVLQQFGSGTDEVLNAAAYRQTISWIDYFKAFDYSQVTVPLNFNVRLYPKKSSKGNLISVKEQVTTINEYFMSKGDSKDTTYTYYAPHGYTPSEAQASTNSIPGTLTLLYGKYAVIENLILTGYQVTFSKELIRLSPSEGSTYSPAYADISVSLSPATVMTQEDIAAILASDFYANSGRNGRGWMTKSVTYGNLYNSYS